MSGQQSKWEESFKLGRDYNPMNEILLNLILNGANLNKKTAIDLGCGTGDIVLKLAKKGMQVTGFDWSPSALARARKRSEDASLLDRTSFKTLDLNNITEEKLPLGVTDIIFCKLVIAFIKDKKKFCESVKMLLAPNGTFVIQTPVLHKQIDYLPEDKPDIAVDYEEFKNLLDSIFNEVVELNHSYYGERGDLVTFIVK